MSHSIQDFSLEANLMKPKKIELHQEEITVRTLCIQNLSRSNFIKKLNLSSGIH